MDNISVIKQKFIEISSARESVILVMENIKIKIDELKSMHLKLASRNKLHNLGLDALNFQAKLLDSDFECNDSKFKFINNRIYCDYYKFYKIVLRYIIKNIDDFKVLNCYNRHRYPVYNDLEKYKEYDFAHVQDIHYNITKIIIELQGMLLAKNQELKEDETKTRQGLNIHNYVNDTRHLNNIINEEVQLFMNYLSVFNVYHKKYFDNFSLRAKLLYGQIKSDINLDMELTKCDSGSSVELDEKEESSMRSMIGCRNSGGDGGVGLGLGLLEKVLGKLRSPGNNSTRNLFTRKEDPIKEGADEDANEERYSSDTSDDPSIEFELNGKCLIRNVIVRP